VFRTLADFVFKFQQRPAEGVTNFQPVFASSLEIFRIFGDFLVSQMIQQEKISHLSATLGQIIRGIPASLPHERQAMREVIQVALEPLMKNIEKLDALLK
jgi:hypothetical protein